MVESEEHLIDQIRQVVERFIKTHYVEEEQFFPAVWEAFEKWVRQLKIPVEKIVLADVLHTRAGLGFVGEEGLDLVSPIVLSTVAETLQQSRSGKLSASKLERIVGKAATRAGAAGELLACLVQRLPEMVIAIRSADDSVSEAYVSVVKKGQKQQIEVKFTSTTSVIVNEKEVAFDNAWRMLEYFLWKKDRVHWTEGYLIYPGWWEKGVKDARKLFREKNADYANKLQSKYGFELEFKTDRRHKADYWKLVRHNLSTNIPNSENYYKKARQLFENGDFMEAKTELSRGLEFYPNHLQSHLLLTKCYEEQDFVNVSPEEINRILRPTWRYLRQKCDALDGISNIACKNKDQELQVFLSELKSNPIYSGINEHTRVLGKWLSEKAFAKDDKILVKLKTLLETIAATKDDSVKKEKIAELYQIDCVREVMRSMGENWLRIASRLFYPESEGNYRSNRLVVMSKRNFSTVRGFKRYLKKTLKSVEREIPGEVIELSGISQKMNRRIKQVNKVEAKLRQKLHKEPSEPELIEALEIEQGWDIEEIKDVLSFRNLQVTLRGDMSILSNKEGSPCTDDKDNGQVIQ